MSFNQNLHKELDQWLKEGLVSPETAEILRTRYPIVKRSMTQTLAFLGSILIGIGVILFFAANWEAMSKAVKVLTVVLSFTLAYSSGYYLTYIKKEYIRVGHALIFLGSILYGSAIWLIAQIFHLEAESGLGFFLWYLGVIPAAWLFNSSLHLALAAINLIFWFLTGQYPLGLPYIIFPLLFALTVAPLAVIKRDSFNFTAVVIAAYIWFIPLGVKLAHDNSSFHLGIVSLLLISILLYTLVKSLSGKGFFAEDFLLALVFIGLFVGFAPFSFQDFLREFTLKMDLHEFPYLLAVTLIITGIFKYRDLTLKLTDLPLLLLYPVICLFSPLLSSSMTFLILNNILLFAYTLLIIYYGYQRRRPFIFNLSLLMFAAAVVMKYFDIFFALMPRSVFFMSGGVLLLGGSILLENKRRNLLKAMERGEAR